jgi:hypothetical protein
MKYLNIAKLETLKLMKISAAAIRVFNFSYKSNTHNRRFLFDSNVQFF